MVLIVCVNELSGIYLFTLLGVFPETLPPFYLLVQLVDKDT